jgi:hypothetical protein
MSTATPAGEFPAANGDPGTDVNAPVGASMVKTDTAFEQLVTYRYLTIGSTATPSGQLVANGEPGTGVNAPITASMVKAETVFEPGSATYRNLPDGSASADNPAYPLSTNGEFATALSAPVAAWNPYPPT